MARRYCGRIKIRLEWSDARSHYDARVTDADGRTVRVTVGRAPADRTAVDCPEAYDDAARAALAFALDERDADDHAILTDRGAQYDGHGYYVTREAAHRVYTAQADLLAYARRRVS